VVLGRESLDELQALVTTKFSGYANKKIAVPKFEADAFQGGLGKLYRVVPVKDLRTLSLLWALPYIEKEHYHTKPEHVLSHLVGHEGDGSILQLLKAKGWANELSAGLNHSTTAFSAFSVSIDLCEEGLEHITEIVAIVFQYLRVLSEATDAKWAETYKEVSDVDEMSFRFKSKESPFNYCSSLAGSMHEYAPEEVLSGPFLTSKFDLPLIKGMLASLRKADLRVHVISQTFKGVTTEKEKWYDTEYSVEDFNAELLTAIHSPTANSALSMPSPNEFIATDFALRSANDVPADAAPILIESPGVKCWWKLDQKYLKPKANVVVRLDNPVAYASPRAAMLTTLYTSLLEDSLVTYAYHADVAGLSYSLDLTSTGLQLMFRGYNHKLSVLAQKVLEEMRTMRAKPDRFALIKEAVERELKNFSLEQPYQHAMYYFFLSAP
jgi:insulysin